MSNCLSRKSPRQTSHRHLFIFVPPFYTSLASYNASCLFFFFFLSNSHQVKSELILVDEVWNKQNLSQRKKALMVNFRQSNVWILFWGRWVQAVLPGLPECSLHSVTLLFWLQSHSRLPRSESQICCLHTLSSSCGSVLGHNPSGFSVLLSMAEKVIKPIL